MGHNQPDPASETPSDDRIGQAIELAQRIKVLRAAGKKAGDLGADLGDVCPVAKLTERIETFCNRNGDPATLDLQRDPLLLERLQGVAGYLEQKSAAVLEAAEARLRELFREESPATSGGRIAFRNVLERGKATKLDAWEPPAKKLEAWQQAAVDQVAADVGAAGEWDDSFRVGIPSVEPHPAGAEFSSDRPRPTDPATLYAVEAAEEASALRAIDERSARFSSHLADLERATTEEQIVATLRAADQHAVSDQLTEEQFGRVGTCAHVALLRVRGPASPEGGVQ